MPSPLNCLPVYGPDNALLYHAPIARVPHMLQSGRVRPLGSKHRIRALVATCGETACELLALARVSSGVRFSHNHETDTNPPRVWAFRRIYECR